MTVGAPANRAAGADELLEPAKRPSPSVAPVAASRAPHPGGIVGERSCERIDMGAWPWECQSRAFALVTDTVVTTRADHTASNYGDGTGRRHREFNDVNGPDQQHL